MKNGWIGLTITVTVTMAALSGCGVETASTAVTAAALKKQEVEQGRKTLDQAQQKIGQAMEQAQQRAGQSEDSAPQ
jgi:polyhydroxyalkanoate synthesis regulator phasin